MIHSNYTKTKEKNRCTMQRRMFSILIVTLGLYINVAGSTSCSSSFRPSVSLCESSYTSVTAFLLSFHRFQTSGAANCTCRIFIQHGSKLSFNYLSSPGYYGCGTEIRISGRSTSVIRCLPAAQTMIVDPGDIVTVEIVKDGPYSHVNSQYCYSMKIENYETNTDGLVTVICDRPVISTTISTSTTTTTTPPSKPTPVSSEPPVTNRTEDLESATSPTTAEHPQKTPISLHRVDLPWEIITPVSLLLLFIVVAVVVIFKVRKGRKRRTRLKMTMMGTNHLSVSCISPTYVPPKQTTVPSDRRTNETTSGDYSILNENVVQTTAEVKESDEVHKLEEKADDSSLEAEMDEHSHGSSNVGGTGLSENEKSTLCASMDLIEKFIEETTHLALARFHQDESSPANDDKDSKSNYDQSHPGENPQPRKYHEEEGSASPTYLTKVISGTSSEKKTSYDEEALSERSTCSKERTMSDSGIICSQKANVLSTLNDYDGQIIVTNHETDVKSSGSLSTDSDVSQDDVTVAKSYTVTEEHSLGSGAGYDSDPPCDFVIDVLARV